MAASDWNGGRHVFDEIAAWLGCVAAIMLAVAYYREPLAISPRLARG